MKRPTDRQPSSKHQSCISRESGFQSFNGSVSSVYSTGMPTMHGGLNEDEKDFDQQSSTGSLLSLMSAQSALNMMAPPSMLSGSLRDHNPRYSLHENSSSFNRVDQKRHSLTSLSKYQPAATSTSIGSRNSYLRRSAIIPRSSRRSMMMSSIIEHQRK